jgi:hypothetical protein
MEVWTLWHPTYWLSGGVKSLTALSSHSTAAGLIWLFPHILRFIHAAKISEHGGRS